MKNLQKFYASIIARNKGRKIMEKLKIRLGFYKDDGFNKLFTFVRKAKEIGLGLNAGHDLNLQNLTFFAQQIPWLDEVSIGHALISDALYLGIEQTIRQYKECLK